MNKCNEFGRILGLDRWAVEYHFANSNEEKQHSPSPRETTSFLKSNNDDQVNNNDINHTENIDEKQDAKIDNDNGKDKDIDKYAFEKAILSNFHVPLPRHFVCTSFLFFLFSKYNI